MTTPNDAAVAVMTDIDAEAGRTAVHTPTPWRVNGKMSIRGPNGEYIAKVNWRGGATDAHHIVEAVNAYASTQARLSKERDVELARDLDAGREWLRCAWQELNAIRARDGAPIGVSEQWWDTLTEALRELLGDDAKPWMIGSVRRLVAPYEQRAEDTDALLAEKDKRIGELERERNEWRQVAKVEAEMRRGANDHVVALEADSKALREALEQCAAALQMFPSCEREIIKFTGKWKRYGSTRISNILDRASAALATQQADEKGGAA